MLSTAPEAAFVVQWRQIIYRFFLKNLQASHVQRRHVHLGIPVSPRSFDSRPSLLQFSHALLALGRVFINSSQWVFPDILNGDRPPLVTPRLQGSVNMPRVQATGLPTSSPGRPHNNEATSPPVSPITRSSHSSGSTGEIPVSQPPPRWQRLWSRLPSLPFSPSAILHRPAFGPVSYTHL